MSTLALYPELRRHVRAVVTLQSPFGGSVIANDLVTTPSLRRLLDVTFPPLFQGDAGSVEDLSYARRMEFVRQHPYPRDIPTVSLATSRLSRRSLLRPLCAYVHERYGWARDGLVNAVDAEVPGSRVVRLDDDCPGNRGARREMMGEMVFPLSIRSWLLAPCMLLAAACTAPRPNPYVVTPNPGETLTSLPGPMPDFGPYTQVSDALLAACPVIIGQPHASIPVSRANPNFSVYWRTTSEYCAWLYSIDGTQVEMSLLTTSPVQDDPTRRRCDLPAQVVDKRHPDAAVAYLVMLHNHPGGERISPPDLQSIAEMARIHGPTTRLGGQHISISIAAFFSEVRDDKPECAGFYHYVPARSDEMLRYTVDNGRLTRKVVARVAWSDNGIAKILPVEEQP